MRTALAVALAVVGTAVAFSVLPRGKAATPSHASAGRYSITHTYQNRAYMLDTETGAVWELTRADYCESKSPVATIRLAPFAEPCKENETAWSDVEQFQRITVEGLYTSPEQKVIEMLMQRQLQQQTTTPKK